MRKAGYFTVQLDIGELERFDAAALRAAGPGYVFRKTYPVGKAETRGRVVAELERPRIRTREPVDAGGRAEDISVKECGWRNPRS